MDLIRNLKKWSKISSKHFLSRNCQFSSKLAISTLMVIKNLEFLVKNDRFWWKLTALRPRKRLLDYVYDMNLVRNVQKCSKMRSFKIKRKRGDWKSLKKLGKKFSSGAASSLISQVFKISLLIGQSSVGSTCDQRQSPPIGGNTNRVANRLSEFQMKWK